MAKEKAAAKSKDKDEKEDGYKGHRSGSRKEAVHKVYDQKGAEAALKFGVGKELKESTLHNWFSAWGGGVKKAAKSKDEKKPAAKKAAAKRPAKRDQEEAEA